MVCVTALCVMKTVLVLLVTFFTTLNCKQYALFVAGSGLFKDYHVEASVLEGLSILLEQGMSGDDIILMAFNTVAIDTENKYSGELYSRPDGPNVAVNDDKVQYHGKAQMTSGNLINIISGLGASGKRDFKLVKGDKLLVYMTGKSIHGCLYLGDELIDMIAFMEALKVQTTAGVDIVVFADYSRADFFQFFERLENDERLLVVTSTGPTERLKTVYHVSDMDIDLSTAMGASLWPAISKSDSGYMTFADLVNILKAGVRESSVNVYGGLAMLQLPLRIFFPQSECSVTTGDAKDRRCYDRDQTLNEWLTAELVKKSESGQIQILEDCMFFLGPLPPTGQNTLIDAYNGECNILKSKVQAATELIVAVIDQYSPCSESTNQDHPLSVDEMKNYKIIIEHLLVKCNLLPRTPSVLEKMGELRKLVRCPTDIDSIKNFITSKCGAASLLSSTASQDED